MREPKQEAGYAVIVQEFGEIRKVGFHAEEAEAVEAAKRALLDSSSSEPAVEAFVIAATRYCTS